MTDTHIVSEIRAELGEGAYWDPVDQVLWWVDIWGRLIHRLDPAKKAEVAFPTPSYIGSLAVRASGGLIVALMDGFYGFDPVTRTFSPIVLPQSRHPLTRFNDGRTDRQGRFWCGTVFEDPPRATEFVGALYRLDKDLSCRKLVEGIGSSNGLAFSPDGKTLYFADSQGGFVWAWDLDPVTGDIEHRRIFIDFRDSGGCADGATVDSEGCYWSTMPESGKLMRFDPDGQLMRTIMLATSIPTCCEFGGPELDILYVTSARLRKLKDPLAGALFAIDVGVKGVPSTPFKG